MVRRDEKQVLKIAELDRNNSHILA